jgi:hypothetical protein
LKAEAEAMLAEDVGRTDERGRGHCRSPQKNGARPDRRGGEGGVA